MEYKEDIRIQKTRRDLRNSIINLLTKKPIEKISVTEICDNALINRITFYKYYEDKYTLLDDSLHEIKDDILRQLPNKKNITSIEEASQYLADIINVVINFIENNTLLITSLYKNGNNKLFNIITNICEGAINDLLYEINKIKPIKYNIPSLSSFIYGGFMSTIYYWLGHPDSIKKDDVLELITDLRNNLINFDFVFKKIK